MGPGLTAVLLVGFILGIIPAVAFPIAYHVLTRGGWLDSAIGKTTMLLGASVAWLYLSSLLSLFLGPIAFGVIEATAYFFLALGLWNRLLVFWNIQRKQGD